MSVPMSREEYIAMQASISERHATTVATVMGEVVARMMARLDEMWNREQNAEAPTPEALAKQAADARNRMRDGFAAAALSGLCAAHKDGEWTGNCKQAAKEAYQLADDMLAERDKCGAAQSSE